MHSLSGLTTPHRDLSSSAMITSAARRDVQSVARKPTAPGYAHMYSTCTAALHPSTLHLSTFHLHFSTFHLHFSTSHLSTTQDPDIAKDFRVPAPFRATHAQAPRYMRLHGSAAVPVLRHPPPARLHCPAWPARTCCSRSWCRRCWREDADSASAGSGPAQTCKGFTIPLPWVQQLQGFRVWRHCYRAGLNGRRAEHA